MEEFLENYPSVSREQVSEVIKLASNFSIIKSYSVKILIDENLPLKLKASFITEHEVYSVREMQWTGKKNGELLGLMTLEGFRGACHNG
jgi:hypothetical protein